MQEGACTPSHLARIAGAFPGLFLFLFFLPKYLLILTVWTLYLLVIGQPC